MQRAHLDFIFPDGETRFSLGENLRISGVLQLQTASLNPSAVAWLGNTLMCHTGAHGVGTDVERHLSFVQQQHAVA